MIHTPRNMGFVRSLTRLYTFHTPFKRGTYRLALASLRYGGELPERLLIDTADGCRMIVDPANEGYQFTYFFGEYEPAVSHCFRNSVLPGDICLDIGANAGWFTTLLMKLSGPAGEVHAFEPVPATYQRLSENVRLNENLSRCFPNNVALGEKSGEIEMILEEGDPDGHATISHSNVKELGSRVANAKIVTLDSYLIEKGIDRVDFLKADIEGSELSMLKGASRIFEQDIPPILEIEMALATSVRFGYKPNDLISLINSRRQYDFYEISEQGRILTPIDGFDAESVGANVLCIPEGKYADRRARLGI